MRVSLDPDAAEYIRRKGGHLILFRAQLTGCCGIGSAPAPMWEIGPPRRPLENYRVEQIQGVTVYVDRALDESGPDLCIVLDKVFGWQSLSILQEGALTP